MANSSMDIFVTYWEAGEWRIAINGVVRGFEDLDGLMQYLEDRRLDDASRNRCRDARTAAAVHQLAGYGPAN